MEDGAVVEAAVDVAEEVLHRDRRLAGIQFHLDLAERGGQQYMRLGRIGGEHGAGEEQGGGGEQQAFEQGHWHFLAGCERSTCSRKSSRVRLNCSGWSSGVAWRESSITTRRALGRRST
ncbi:hypothetical protein D3C76_1353920 [compost metagenome]